MTVPLISKALASENGATVAEISQTLREGFDSKEIVDIEKNKINIFAFRRCLP